MTASSSGSSWCNPLGAAGRAEVTELLGVTALPRYFAADRGVELALARTEIGGRALDVGARWQLRFVRSAEDIVVALDLTGDPDPSGGYEKSLRVLDSAGSILLQADESRGSRLRGALRFLRVSAGDRAWVWHFQGGRTAGELLVLTSGRVPGDSAPLVSTRPASRGRTVGKPTGGATADTHVTTWTAAATLLDVAVAELLATARLDRLVDYRASRIAEGFGELLDVLPRPEANTD